MMVGAADLFIAFLPRVTGRGWHFLRCAAACWNEHQMIAHPDSPDEPRIDVNGRPILNWLKVQIRRTAGDRPNDDKQPPYDPKVPLSEQFANPVHFVRLSNDGLVYLCDRGSRQIERGATAGARRTAGRWRRNLHGLRFG